MYVPHVGFGVKLVRLQQMLWFAEFYKSQFIINSGIPLFDVSLMVNVSTV